MKTHNIKHFTKKHRRKLSKARLERKARLGYLHSSETRKKISEAHKGVKLSSKHRKRISECHRGLKHSEKTKKKMREAHKGKKPYEMTDRTRKRMSEARMGYKISKETRMKISEIKKGKIHSEKTKDKIRVARLKQILPTIDTSIELKTEDYLQKKRINYIHPFNLGNRFQCDFYLPLLNLIVECDGTYWHSREDMKKRDKAKDAYAKKCGFNILRLTEEQINQGRFSKKLSE